MTIKYVFHMDGREAEAEELAIPGVPNGKIRVLAVSPNDGAVVVRLTGVSKNPADEFQAATVESLSVDVTRKPLIGLVWGGFYVMMAGGLLAFLKRASEARKAVLDASRRDRRCAAWLAGGARRARPLPANARSPLS